MEQGEKEIIIIAKSLSDTVRELIQDKREDRKDKQQERQANLIMNFRQCLLLFACFTVLAISISMVIYKLGAKEIECSYGYELKITNTAEATADVEGGENNSKETEETKETKN